MTVTGLVAVPVEVMPTEEASWVARAKAGDQAAFAALFSCYDRRIYGFV